MLLPIKAGFLHRLQGTELKKRKHFTSRGSDINIINKINCSLNKFAAVSKRNAFIGNKSVTINVDPGVSYVQIFLVVAVNKYFI